MRTSRIFRGSLIPAALLSVLGCSTGSPTDDDEPGNSPNTPTSPTGGSDNGVFESAHPSGANAANDRKSPGDAESAIDLGAGPVGVNPSSGSTPPPAGTTAANAPQPEPTDPTGDAAEPNEDGSVDANRAIEEADIIKREGDRLYALSAYGGLSIVDISDPDALSVLGRHRTTATPFEMYVRDETVFVLYNGYAEYLYDEDTESYTYYQTSYVISLDVSNPKQIAEAQKFEINGYIADSRVVGDAMYVVAYDDAYCYRCGDTPETNVLALNLSDPKKITKVDELSFPEQQDSYSWRRSLSGTDERLYIAGPRYGNGAEPEGSIIQVVDISDASGDMEAGDSLEVAGQINSRWQMDEYEGVLRVVSQPLWWTDGGEPFVETFEIKSSEELVALGSVQLVLPRPETLQAVRFDGDRGYAITFERTDPLFTIDLSDPATPTQMGELEMPGWVYHMEPRGDRLVGLGYDQGNSDGGLTVSLFDVSDLTTPTMISRVNFGGAWGELAEDQDRIHKSFQVLDSEELILVPFSGWTYSETVDECSSSQTHVSGVQLVGWADDALALHGVAASQGRSRRALLHKDRLLTMSDERVESFDIDDRDEPSSTSQVDLAQIVNNLEVAGDAIVRVGDDWWRSDSLEVTVSTLDELVDYAPGAKVEVPSSSYSCDSETYLQEIKSGGDNVYFMYRSYDWSKESKQAMKVVTLDVSDVSEPKLAGEATLDFYPSSGRSHVPGMINNGASSVGVGEQLVFTQHDIQYNNLGFITESGYSLEVVDLSDANEPRRTSLTMPNSLGSTGLLVSGDLVVSSHFEVSPNNANNVRFYLDRVDLSEPEEPKLLDPVNIPGSLLAYDAEQARALTVDYYDAYIEDISPQQCYEEEFGQFLSSDPSLVDWEAGRGACTARRFKLHLVEVGNETASIVESYDVDKGVSISAVAMGDDRVFLGTGTSGGYYGDSISVASTPASSPGIAIGGSGVIGYYNYPVTTSQAKLLVASGLSSGELEVATVELEVTDRFYGFSALRAQGKKAVLAAGWQGQMSVIDASDAANPVVSSSIELAGSVSDMEIVGDTAVAALGRSGVQTLSLADDE